MLESVKKRPHKSIRKLVKPVLMIVDKDVGLNDIVLTNVTTLVGRFGGRKFNSDSLNGWATSVWKDIIKETSAVFILPRGWIAFKFINEEDANLVMASVWRWDNAGLLIKRWTPLFDPQIERYDQVPIWVKLINLPFEFWSVYFFKLVGNTLSTHLETDLSYLQTGV